CLCVRTIIPPAPRRMSEIVISPNSATLVEQRSHAMQHRTNVRNILNLVTARSYKCPQPSFRSRIALALSLIPLLAAVASAQTFRGKILGTVTDPNGAVVSGANVTVKHTSTGLERATTTDDAGNYTVAELPIGPYEVRVEHTGFVRSVVSNVAVEVAS